MYGIVVDASTIGGNPGLTEFRGVDLSTNKIVFSKQVGMATNNIGEYLAIAYGVDYIQKNNLNLPLFSDSQICINWYHKKILRTNFFKDYPDKAKQNGQLPRLLTEAQAIIKSSNVVVKFWRNSIKENPADYGRK